VKNKKVKKKHLLIIGGTGFIGYNCFKYAKKFNWRCTSVSRNFPNKERKIKKVNYLKLNINNQNEIKKKLNDNFTHIINLVGSSNQVLEKKNKKSINTTHFESSKNIMNFFVEKKIHKFIQIGSAAEYGQKKIPHKENIKCLPISDYGVAKLKTTKHLLDLFTQRSFNGVVVRLFQVYGKKQDQEKIIPYILNNCLVNKKFKLTKGTQTRDFCYIEDVVRAIFLLLDKNEDINGKIYNVASGKDISIKSLVSLIKNIVGSGKPIFGKKKIKTSDVDKSKADINQIKKIGWRPKISLEKGINIILKDK
jgi:nucleoside-diphosphate-sugar epimerase